MATPADYPLRFLHLADLHIMVCPDHGARGLDSGGRCHVCLNVSVKSSILGRLAARFDDASTRPDLLLLAGDLTERRDLGDNVRRATEPLDSFVAAARARGTTVVGITGDHDGEGATRWMRSELGWDWLLESGDVNRACGVAVYGVEGRPNRRGAAADLRRLRPVAGEPSIVLVHDDVASLRGGDVPKFDYFAMGHLHQSRIRSQSRTSRALIGYPGHLLSYWDGDGKAWPVHAIEGSVRSDGLVTAEFLSLAHAAGAPETRRMYVDFSDVGRPDGTVVFENAPGAEFFSHRGIEACVEQEFRDRAPFRLTARISYGSRAELRDTLRKMLEALPDDVFVTPSTGGGWRDRVADHGREIAARRFDEFVAKTFKRDAKTQ